MILGDARDSIASSQRPVPDLPSSCSISALTSVRLSPRAGSSPGSDVSSSSTPTWTFTSHRRNTWWISPWSRSTWDPLRPRTLSAPRRRQAARRRLRGGVRPGRDGAQARSPLTGRRRSRRRATRPRIPGDRTGAHRHVVLPGRARGEPAAQSGRCVSSVAQERNRRPARAVNAASSAVLRFKPCNVP